MKKGDTVNRVELWNDRPGDNTTTPMMLTVSKSMTLQSMGAKRGTATYMDDDGVFVKNRLYAGEIGVTLFDEADIDAGIEVQREKLRQSMLQTARSSKYNEKKYSNDDFWRERRKNALIRLRRKDWKTAGVIRFDQGAQAKDFFNL